MGEKPNGPNYHRRVIRIPDFDDCKLAVLNSLSSPASRRTITPRVIRSAL